MTVGLEESPEQVISDSALFQEWDKTLCDRLVSVPDGTDQQIKSVDTFTTCCSTSSLICPIRFELRKVVKQYVLLNLGCLSAISSLQRYAHRTNSRFVFTKAEPFDILEHDSQNVPQAFRFDVDVRNGLEARPVYY